MYHIYVRKENGEFKIYGQFVGGKSEVNELVNYWNFFYPDRYIEPVK